MIKSLQPIDVAFKPYFDIKKFESNIYNMDLERERKIKLKKKQKTIDSILLISFTFFLIGLVLVASIMGYQYAKNLTLDYKIGKLEKDIETYRDEYSNKSKSLGKMVELDELKMKAYLELNMILPTEKNIIYFDKSDQGFVRQYENIH